MKKCELNVLMKSGSEKIHLNITIIKKKLIENQLLGCITCIYCTATHKLMFLYCLLSDREHFTRLYIT